MKADDLDDSNEDDADDEGDDGGGAVEEGKDLMEFVEVVAVKVDAVCASVG